MANPTSAADALALRNEQAKTPPQIVKDIRSMEKEFAKAMPRGEEAVQLVRDAITVVNKTPKLAECEPTSVLGSLMTCAQLGLRPAVLGEAFVLPFWDSKSSGYQAQLIIGYPGYIRLALESQLVDSLMPRLVHEEDEFDVDYGVSDTLIHKPARGRLRGPVTDYYAISKFRSGGHAFFVMNRPEVEEHRDRFATTKTRAGKIFGPWVDHFDAMGQKTTIRMLAKYLPKTPRLAVARYVDGGLRLDLNPKADAADVTEHPTVEGTVVPPDETDGTLDPNAPITDDMRVRLMALATDMGQDRPERIAYYQQVTGRNSIESVKDLKVGEAAKLIRAYENWKRQSEPQ
jgi:recombination protein RecT